MNDEPSTSHGTSAEEQSDGSDDTSGTLGEFVPDEAAASGEGTSEQRLRSDGGSADLPFEITSNVEETWTEKLQYLFREHVVTPVSIIADDWRAKAGFGILGFYFLMALYSTQVDKTYPADGPQLIGAFQNWDYPLGTDSSGQDILSQTVNATPDMLIMAGSGALFVVVVGTTVGLVAGYKGGTVDTALSTVTDVFINIPGLPLVMVLAALLKDLLGNPAVVGIFLAIAGWAGLARAVRSQVLAIRSQETIESARALDLSRRWILFREILPKLMPYISVRAMGAARSIIFAAVGLYYLGILPFTDSNWGVMLSTAEEAGALYRPAAYHWLFVPMIVITVLALALILLAQSLDRVFNPRIRARHQSDGENYEIEP